MTRPAGRVRRRVRLGVLVTAVTAVLGTYVAVSITGASAADRLGQRASLVKALSRDLATVL